TALRATLSSGRWITYCHASLDERFERVTYRDDIVNHIYIELASHLLHSLFWGTDSMKL
ncbi:unnamed protein product, partial [Ixodes persulcatus]